MLKLVQRLAKKQSNKNKGELLSLIYCSQTRKSLELAEAEGFEPSSRLLGYLISSQARYDHFDTLPYESPEIFRGFLIVDVDYLFENCGALLAFLRPYFFLSFALGSLVKKPAFFKDAFVSSSARTNALEIPCLIAPA